MQNNNKIYYYKTIIGTLIILSLSYLVLFFDANKIYGGINYNVVLKNSSGIKKGDHIYLNGYSVGKVTDIYLLDNYNVNIVINVNENIKITKDSAISLLTDSFLSGSKIITIIMGIDEEYFSENDRIYNSNLGFNLNSFLDSLIWYLNMKKTEMQNKLNGDSSGEKTNAK